MDDHGCSRLTQSTLCVLDTSVLIHDPDALSNFQEHRITIPITVLKELDKLETGKHTIAAECRQVVRLIDQVLGEATPEQVEGGVSVQHGKNGPNGSLSILMGKHAKPVIWLPEHLNDNKIINQLVELKSRHGDVCVVLMTKDISMRLEAHAYGVDAGDYHTDQLVDDVALLSHGYHSLAGSFRDHASRVETRQDHGRI